jgi:hypothetical protein
MHRCLKFRTPAIALCACLAWSPFATAFNNNGRWLSTATDGPTDPLGRPATLTWSIVPDGTNISHLATPSNLVNFFDTLFPGGSGSDLTARPWFPIVQGCFDRWTETSGVTFVYEGTDDGLLPSPHPHGSWLGALNSRGDVRLAGAFIDGDGGTYATAGVVTPGAQNGDITIDTGDDDYYSNPAPSDTFVRFRNTLTHEIGHSLGLGHISSSNRALLMEGTVETTPSFDGPQIDDIQGAHFIYGDFNEKSNAGAGNETTALATPLGTVNAGQTVSRGNHATGGFEVFPGETDFISISNSTDVDFFSFAITEPSLVDLTLTPLGYAYNHNGASINTTTVSNLSLELYSEVEGLPVLLTSQSANPAGSAESILDFELETAGTYFARIAGSGSSTQFYRLEVGAETLIIEPPLLAGDFNNDGVVDAVDYTVWRNHLGEPDETSIFERGDGQNGVDDADYLVWKDHYGDLASGSGGIIAAPVPEPPLAAGVAAILFAISPIWRVARHLAGSSFRRSS